MQMAVLVNTFLTKKQSIVEGWMDRKTLHSICSGCFRYVILTAVLLNVQFL